ncbi:MAG: cation:proton antiporter [Alphaproteobacteria bacterium]|nr:cation:proton antiporter [Alphaproteobacteria bacterium]
MSQVASVVFGLAALLALASLLLPLSRRLNLPYTVVLALAGLGLGTALVTGVTPPGLAGGFLTTLRGLGLSSDAFLYLFLPPLLFHAGLTIDSRRLMDDIGPVIVLAVVAVLVCTLAVGFGLAAVSGHGLAVCLLIGAIVSTTDSSAIVAIFRTMGAPRRLTIIVEGESLFNDAAAIASFVLLLGIVTASAEPRPGSAVLSFTGGLLGGVAFGWLAGRLTAALIAGIRSVPVAEVTLTVALAYLTFYFAEDHLGVSGITAVVVAAMVMGGEGRTRISPGGWGNLQQTWAQLDFWATSLVFTLAAMLAPSAFAEGMRAEYLWLSLAVFVLAFLARGFVLYGLMPALTLVGIAEPISRGYKAVIWWGGMRGAVTMALALSVSENPAVPEEVKPFVFAVSTGFTLMTLFIMAPTLRPLMKLMSLDRLTRSDVLVRDRVMALARERVRGRLGDILRDIDLNRYAARFDPPNAAGEGDGPRGVGSSPPLSELERVGLLTLANREAELYLDYFARGIVGRRTSDVLRAHAGRMKDAAKVGGFPAYCRAATRYCDFPRAFRLALFVHRWTGWSGLLKAAIAERFEVLLVLDRALRDLRSYNAVSVTALVGKTISERLRGEIQARQEQVAGALAALDLQYPIFAESLRIRYVERIGLLLEEAEYRAQFEQSVISGEVFEDLSERLHQRLEALERRPALDLGLSLSAMLRSVPLFAEADPRTLERIARACRPELAVPGRRIIERGTRGDRMYFIAAGAVRVEAPERTIRLTSGQVFGELALLNDTPRSADVIAEGYVNLLVLHRRDLAGLMRSSPDLRRHIEAIARDRLRENEEARAAR